MNEVEYYEEALMNIAKQLFNNKITPRSKE